MDMRPPIPHEHGAWAQLVIATGAALVVARARPAGFWAWMAALWLAFIAHESLLVLLGQRGARARKDGRTRAWIWLVLLLAGAMAFGLTGLEKASPEARWALILPFGCASLLLPGTLRGEEKSLPGEALAALSLGGAALPLALRAGVPWMAAWQLTAGLMTAFLLATLLIRRFLAVLRQRPEPLSALGAALFTGLGAGMGLALLIEGHGLEGLACLPLPLLGFWLFARSWPPHRLKRLGWWLAFGNIATATLLVMALR
jgi:hypothetical protein